MSNAKTYQGDTAAIVVHYTEQRLRLEGPCLCGSDGWNATSTRTRARVTCKRCLASLAKRDRSFQRKARSGIGHVRAALTQLQSHLFQRLQGEERDWSRNAARAIAREEGRTL